MKSVHEGALDWGKLHWLAFDEFGCFRFHDVGCVVLVDHLWGSPVIGGGKSEQDGTVFDAWLPPRAVAVVDILEEAQLGPWVPERVRFKG